MTTSTTEKVIEWLRTALSFDGVLDEQALMDEAMRNTGLSDFGRPYFRDGLRRLITSFENEARMNAKGRGIAHALLLRHLENRLLVTRDWKLHPEIGNEKIERPIFMVGLPRTGSTILHDLFAQDPDNRAPMTWECHRPSPPTERATFDTDPRIAECDAWIASTSARLVPEYKAIHSMGAQLAQECVMLQGYDFMSIIYANQFRVPSYEAWVEETDLHSVYATHKRQLQYMQWHCPGERWVLKSVGHLWGLDCLFEAYPDARFVLTHRDPVKFLASHASLVAAGRRMTSDDIDPHEIGRDWSKTWEGALRQGMAFRTSGKVDEKQFFDVHFLDFLNDPIAMVGTVYVHFGLHLSAEAERRMRAFLAANPQGKHGQHRYTLDQFGLDPAAVRERFRFYSEHYNVQPEGR